MKSTDSPKLLSRFRILSIWCSVSPTFKKLWDKAVNKGTQLGPVPRDIKTLEDANSREWVDGAIYLPLKEINKANATTAVLLAHELRHATQPESFKGINMEYDAFKYQRKVFNELIKQGYALDESCKPLTKKEIEEAYSGYY